MSIWACRIEDEWIVEVVNSNALPDGYVECPSFVSPHTPRNLWDENWNLRSSGDLIKLGILSLLPQEKCVEGKIVRKTLKEQVDEKLIERPIGKTLNEDETDWRAATRDELVSLCELTATEADALDLAEFNAMRKALYTESSDPVYLRYQRGEASKDDWLSAVQSVKEKIPKPIPRLS